MNQDTTNHLFTYLMNRKITNNVRKPLETEYKKMLGMIKDLVQPRTQIFRSQHLLWQCLLEVRLQIPVMLQPNLDKHIWFLYGNMQHRNSAGNWILPGLVNIGAQRTQ
jgi:hypothetical protein